MSMLRRRTFILTCFAAKSWYVSVAFSQVQPFALRLVRRTGWEQLMARNQCVIGDLYRTVPGFPVADVGVKLCNALELAYRSNTQEISSVPPGEYEGAIRNDPPRGWRIELKGTGERRNIQLHVGNRPNDTEGCILPGTGDTSDAGCRIGGSVAAMKLIQDAYADPTNKRGVVLRIQS